jgi:gluconate kinase
MALGHEISGVILETGVAVSGLKPGMKAALDPSRPCLSCAYCRAGRSNLCTNMPDGLSAFTGDGGYFDVAFEASGSPAALESIFKVIRRGGRIVQVGMLPRFYPAPTRSPRKMAAGTALTDEDRRPFLDKVARVIGAAGERGVVISCSALKRRYRDRIRSGAARVSGRAGHFMPASLLHSQLAILEPPQPDELSIQVDGEALPEAQVCQILAAVQAAGPL